jgi:uncharacterized protein YkwD
LYCPDLSPPPAVAVVRAEEIAEINRRRAEAGVPPLAANAALASAARVRAEAVADAEDVAKAEIGGDDLGRLVESFGYEDRAVAEIVLVGGTSFPDRLARLASSSPDNFAEAMAKDYRDVGVGVAPLEGGASVWALVFGLSVGDDFAAKTAALGDRPAIRRKMLALVNRERSSRRLPPLRESGILDAAAQAHADDMIRRSFYSHENPDGASALDRAHGAGYLPVVVGENIAEGQSSVEEVMQGWMESPRHRGEILSSTMKEIGMGVAFGKNGRGWEIVWVQNFGVPRAAETLRPRR